MIFNCCDKHLNNNKSGKHKRKVGSSPDFDIDKLGTITDVSTSWGCVQRVSGSFIGYSVY